MISSAKKKLLVVMLAFVAAISFGALTFAPTVSAEVKEAPKKVEIYQKKC